MLMSNSCLPGQGNIINCPEVFLKRGGGGGGDFYTCAKRGENASKSSLVLVLLLVGQESGARIFKPITKPSNPKTKAKIYCKIRFDTQLKTTLSFCNDFF